MAKKKPPEATIGSYTPVPHAVLDCAAMMGASHTARSLLFELLRQHNGRNNGHLQCATSWLRRRGWLSVDTVIRARKELVKRGLLVQTRHGGLNNGPSQFALSWLPVSDFSGLDISSREYHPGAWRNLDPLPVLPKLIPLSVTRNSAAPSDGLESNVAGPSGGAKSATSQEVAVP